MTSKPSIIQSRRSRFFIFAASACLAGNLLLQPVRAQTVLYSDLTTFSGNGYAPGGATAATPVTTLLADDIQLSDLAADPITSLSFSIGNLGTKTVSARPIVSIFGSDGTGGGPGTLLQEITFNPISMTAGMVNTYTFSPGSAIFTAPSDGFFWAGMSFDNGGTSTAAVADLNNLGMGLFDPPTVGSSEDAFFQSDNPGVAGTNNPAGDFYYFGGDPVANFGWLFSGVSSSSATPEPNSLMLFLPVVAMAGSFVVRRRRRRQMF